MNTENKNGRFLDNGTEIFVEDLIFHISTGSVWKVLDLRPDTYQLVTIELMQKKSSIYDVGEKNTVILTNDYGLLARDYRNTIRLRANINNGIGLSPTYSVPAILENCQCQSLFMNGHNHSCHMYVAPAPTINVWGIPQPVDNSPLIETIKNTKESSEPWLYTLSVRNDVSHRGHAAAEGDFVPFRVDSTGALRVMTNET